MSKSNIHILYFSFSTIAILLLSCESSASNLSNSPNLSKDNLPIIKVDSHHDFINASNHIGETPPVILQYEIIAGDGFILDVSDYENKITARNISLGITQPNRIQVEVIIYDNDGIYKHIPYYTDWENNKTSYILTAQTLIPLSTVPFTGLESFASSGQRASVAIGFFDKNGQTTGIEMFYPLWGAGINIR